MLEIERKAKRRLINLRYAERNKDRIRIVKRLWYLENRREVIERTRQWKLNNKRKPKVTYKLGKCISCDCLLRDRAMVCEWCLSNYPQKYGTINTLSLSQ